MTEIIKTNNPLSAHRPPIIGVFDSGVGGLTIFRDLEKSLPRADYVYCSDNANFPYGPKSEDEVISCVRAACTKLISKYALDLLVIACNTASTVALPVLRGELKIPVVGVVPAIKPAALSTRSGVIGLLATPGTVKRAYTQNLVNEFAKDCRVILVGSSKLVTIAEAKAHKIKVDLDVVRQEIAPLFAKSSDPNQKIDTVVLGCTHFPIILEELTAAAPWAVRWIDSGAAVAARTKTLLVEKGFHLADIVAGDAPEAITQSNTARAPMRIAVVTKDDDEARLVDSLLGTFGFRTRDLLQS